MSNRDKVVKLAAKELQFGARDGIYLGERIADVLANAGLLAPDAPEPGVFKDGAEVEWDTLDGYVNIENGLIIVAHDERVEGDPPEKDAQLWPEPGQLKFLNPAAAEEIGELLIAAAKYAKRGQP